MFVLIDLEWVTDKENIDHLTQLSAVRTTPKWDVVDHFDKICSIPDGLSLTNHVALSGYDICDFSMSPSMAEVIQQFANWLKDDDILLFWHNSSWMRLAEFMWRFSIVLPSREKRILGERIRKHYGKEHGSAYEICYAKNIDVPAPEHCSRNDVCAILALLLDSGMDLSASTASIPQLPTKLAPNRREKNKEIISRTEYNYLFAAGASIFHKRGCPCMLNAKLVLGSIYYETAAKGRAACRLCKPTPVWMNNNAFAPKKAEAVEAFNASRNDVISVRLITGEIISMKRKKVVGCCHYINHPGKLTKDLMLKHDCVNKGCRHFEKYTDASYWICQDDLRRQKEEIKEKKRQEKERLLQETQDLENIKSILTSYTESSMDIIRVERKHHGLYKVFYVSDNSFADGNRFPGFLDRVRLNHPSWSLMLRHIKDIDGRFVTREEFYARSRR